MAIALAVLTALANALGSLMQRLGLEQSATQPDKIARPKAVASSPLWSCGVALMVLGFCLQAVALHIGSIVLVQPLLLVELPVIVLVLVGWFGQHISLRDSGATLLATLSLGVALACFAPDDGTRQPSLKLWITVCAVTSASGIALSVFGLVSKSGKRAFLLGLSAATGFGLVAALTKQLGDVVVSHPGSLVQTWQLWTLGFVGGAAFFAMQRAFEAGSFAASQSALILGTPVLSIVVGGALFGVSATDVVWRQVLGSLAALVVAIAISVLLRSPILSASHDPSATRLTGTGLLARRNAQRPRP